MTPEEMLSGSIMHLILEEGNQTGPIVEIEDAVKAAKDYAAQEVKNALEAAAEKATMNKWEEVITKSGKRSNEMYIDSTNLKEYIGFEGQDEDQIIIEINKDSILNAYKIND